MFDRNGYDDSRYNLENIAEIAKKSPTEIGRAHV